MSSAGKEPGNRQNVSNLGGAYVQNFNKRGKGRFKVSMKRGQKSKSRSSGRD
jgi:hypothetical protein